MSASTPRDAGSRRESGKFDGPGSESFDGEFETFDLLVGVRYVFSPAM